MSKLIESHYPM
uniref:Uncharacterized protein n=1 Tax=Anguilla anguilla TaxID=7936 RepID=A0A0E9R2Y4_ANGAN